MNSSSLRPASFHLRATGFSLNAVSSCSEFRPKRSPCCHDHIDKPSFTVPLLDDDPSVLKAIARLLRSAGWAAIAFDHPVAFLNHAAVHPIPVAVIDMCMPVMNGLEVQSHLQKSSPATKVIFLTSRDDPSAREKALAAGAFAFLLKPVDDEQLLSLIESVARQVSGARGMQRQGGRIAHVGAIAASPECPAVIESQGRSA